MCVLSFLFVSCTDRLVFLFWGNLIFKEIHEYTLVFRLYSMKKYVQGNPEEIMPVARLFLIHMFAEFVRFQRFWESLKQASIRNRCWIVHYRDILSGILGNALLLVSRLNEHLFQPRFKSGFCKLFCKVQNSI